MGLLSNIVIIFYVAVIWATSILLMLFATRIIKLEDVNHLAAMVYYDSQIGTVVVLIAGAFIIISYILARLLENRRQRQRTIAFNNPSGPVTVSLNALEDLIKRLIVQVPEAKEIRPYVIAVKKGLDADVNLVLRHEVNIPELTGRFQDLVRRKIEETIGMEGKINVRVHVTKISLDDIKGKNKNEFVVEPQVPFHGYRT